MKCNCKLELALLFIFWGFLGIRNQNLKMKNFWENYLQICNWKRIQWNISESFKSSIIPKNWYDLSQKNNKIYFKTNNFEKQPKSRRLGNATPIWIKGTSPNHTNFTHNLFNNWALFPIFLSNNFLAIMQ
jgi:hypothetical protein